MSGENNVYKMKGFALREEKLDNERDLLMSKEYKEYSEYVLGKIGEELEAQYPGVDFMLKLRFKADASYDGKKQKVLFREFGDNKNIFDNIGIAIVVRNVPNNVSVNHEYCKKLLLERDEIKNSILNTKSQNKSLSDKLIEMEEEHKTNLEKFDNNKFFEYLKKAYNEGEEAIISDINHIGEALKTLHREYENKDNECNRIFSTHMLKYVVRHSKALKKEKIIRIKDRTKEHTGGESGYYIASHNAIESKNLKGWKAEIQAVSYQNYKTAEIGDAKHSDRLGKKRVLPELPGETEQEKREFLNMIKPIIPETIVYQAGKGTYKCSLLENFCYYYMENLVKNKDYFKEVNRRDILPDNTEKEEI